jgi:hypothetical protein
MSSVNELYISQPSGVAPWKCGSVAALSYRCCHLTKQPRVYKIKKGGVEKKIKENDPVTPPLKPRLNLPDQAVNPSSSVYNRQIPT